MPKRSARHQNRHRPAQPGTPLRQTPGQFRPYPFILFPTIRNEKEAASSRICHELATNLLIHPD